ncbi:MAG: hypothetical protein M3250_06755 [Thermoproteota archaeon]|nr:hypothetical protein [Thermoproteota archaeon]
MLTDTDKRIRFCYSFKNGGSRILCIISLHMIGYLTNASSTIFKYETCLQEFTNETKLNNHKIIEHLLIDNEAPSILSLT